MSLRLRAWLPAAWRNRLERLEASPLGARLARGAFWSMAGGAVSRLLNLVASMVIARLLQKETYGELGMIQSTIGMFGVFAGFGMGLTATKHVAEYRQRDPARAGRIIALSNWVALLASVVFSLVLVLGAPQLARGPLGAPHLERLLQYSAALLLLGGLSGAQTGILAGFEAFRTMARLNFIGGLAGFPLLVLGSWWGGLTGCVWGLILGQALTCGLNEMAVRQEARRAGIPIRYRWQATESSVLWKFTLPAVLAVSLVGPVHWVCSTWLANQPGGYAHMGAFNAANQWFTALLFLPTLLGQSVLPMMAEQMGSDARAGGLRLLQLSIKVNSLVALPVLVLCTVSPWIMALYGEGFREAWPALVATLLTAALLAVQTPVGQVLIATGKIWPGFLMNVGWAVVYLAMSRWLVPWGATGLATARLVAYSAHAVWTMWYALHILRGRNGLPRTAHA